LPIVAFEVNMRSNQGVTAEVPERTPDAPAPLIGGDPASAASPFREAEVHCCAPVDAIAGNDMADAVTGPLARAFALASERTDIRLGGRWKDGDWQASTGHLAGVFVEDLWGIPATGKAAWLRFARVDRRQDGVLRQSHILFDLPGLMMQAGAWPLARPLGPAILAPAPATQDGVDPAGDGAESLTLVEAMIAGLMQYDGHSLKSMGMPRFWRDDFWWYGPAPIGTFCGHADYERGHQGPFLAAFPDRVGGNHVCRIGAGDYVASAGWPSIRATHSGGDWLGLAATGRPVTMRVMDFWRRDGERLAENWVFIDIPDLLRQLGVNVFARMRAMRGAESGR
jgi:hypothetical protein